MNSKCRHCDSFNFEIEAINGDFTACCNKGSIILPPLKKIPEKIKELYTGFKYIKYLATVSLQ